MKKFLTLIFIMFFSSSFSFAEEPFKLSVKEDYTIDSLRTEAFKNIEKSIDFSIYEPIDPNLIENKEAIRQQKLQINNRSITYDGSGSYSIRFINPNLFDKTFCYNSFGKLEFVAIDVYSIKTKLYETFLKNNNKIYPYKSFIYNYPSGTLASVLINITQEKQYYFYPNGSLIGYCIKNSYYNSNNELLGTAKTFLY